MTRVHFFLLSFTYIETETKKKLNNLPKVHPLSLNKKDISLTCFRKVIYNLVTNPFYFLEKVFNFSDTYMPLPFDTI